MENYEFVQYPIEDKLKEVLKISKKGLFIATPFIKDYGIDVVLRNTGQTRNLKLLTNLDVGNICGRSFDIGCLLKLWDRFQEVSVASLGKLHAKAYISDDEIGFLTSANLTYGGLLENYEYGIIIRDAHLVKVILTDMNKYFELGNIFTRETIENIKDDIAEIKELQRKIEKNVAQKKLGIF